MKKSPSKISLCLSWLLLFSFGFSLLFLPSQSQLIAQAYFRPEAIRKIDLTVPLAPYPLKDTDLEEPSLTARAAAVLDRQSGVFLWAKNPDQPLLPASTVKIMTALVSLEHYSLWDILMVPPVSDEGQDMELVPGELITVEALIYGLLVSSANDAAMALAKNYPGGEAAFVRAMNQKASELSLKEAQFVNPTGLDGEDESFNPRPESVISARNLAWLTDYALGNETFARMVGTKEMTLQDPQHRFVHRLYNLNQLLWTIPGVRGVKTGWTEKAGECLVTHLEKDNHGVIVVVLGSLDRFGETETLINWIFANYQWRPLTES